MSDVKPISRRSLNEDVADRIRHYILDRELRVGDRLPTEQEFADLFGVSRTSVREATRALSFLGIVESAPRRGMTVAQLDMQRLTRYLGFHFAIADYPLNELLEARIAIECGALASTMLRMQADPQVYERLAAINDELDSVSDADRFIELDSAFHRGLVEASGVGPLVAFSDLLHVFFRAFRASIIEKRSQWRDGVRTQREILEALRRKHLNKAVTLLRDHLEAHRDQLGEAGNRPHALVPLRAMQAASHAEVTRPSPMATRDLSQQVAIVTGAGRGIGQAIADALSRSGCIVVYTDLDASAAKQAASAFETAAAMQLDVTRPPTIKRVVKDLMAKHGRIDVLVNNAGINTLDHRVPIDEFPREEWDRIMAVDLDGVFEVSRAVLPAMRSRRYGRVINITSIAGLVPLRLQSAFVAAKAGVANLTRSMAIELASDGIVVNAIAPGSTLTDGTRALFYGKDGRYKASAQRLMDHIPLGRPGTVDEIAQAALFLADPQNTYMTGHILTVDGGWTAGYARDF